MRGGFSWYIGLEPRGQEGAFKSLKGPIVLTINVYFDFSFFGVFSAIFSLFILPCTISLGGPGRIIVMYDIILVFITRQYNIDIRTELLCMTSFYSIIT